jgi:hypothetical protein
MALKDEVKKVAETVDEITDRLVELSYDLEEEKGEEVRSKALQINALVRELTKLRK